MFLKTLTAVSLTVAAMAANAATTTVFTDSDVNGFAYTFNSNGTASATFTGFNGFDITNVLLSGVNTQTWTSSISHGNETWTLGPTSLLAGSHTFTISGFGGNTSYVTGSYSYTAQTLSAPVPEPESYAMLLAGLGALGFMGRRRNRNAG